MSFLNKGQCGKFLPAFPDDFWRYIAILIPLILTSVLQRLEFVIDNRFIHALGSEAVNIQAIQNSFFSLGQSLGIAGAASVLVFWKSTRKGSLNHLLNAHVGASLAVGLIAALVFIPLLPNLLARFQVAQSNSSIANFYLWIGLTALPLQAAYVTVNAVLIGQDKRIQSTFLILVILIAKFAVNFFLIWNFTRQDDLRPNWHTVFFQIGIANAAIMVVALTCAVWYAIDQEPHEPEPFKENWMQVWFHELWFSVVRGYAPIFLILIIARVSEGFVTTFQFTATIAYFLALPLVAGNQLALRDAAAEQKAFGLISLLPLKKSKWFSNYFYSAFLLSELLLLIGAFTGPTILSNLFGYLTPPAHLSFVSAYFLVCMIGQVGHMFVIQLRASRLSKVVSRNILISEVFVQLLLSYFLVQLDMATPFAIAAVAVGGYCLTYVAINFFSSARAMRLDFVGSNR